ncbi:MAG: hypothetical protein PWR03_1817, partial [Tenuifilum sp.]|nr:hypothetical protein [Tenuifilum sp.]
AKVELRFQLRKPPCKKNYTFFQNKPYQPASQVEKF